jgi:hypothetical protein
MGTIYRHTKLNQRVYRLTKNGVILRLKTIWSWRGGKWMTWRTGWIDECESQPTDSRKKTENRWREGRVCDDDDRRDTVWRVESPLKEVYYQILFSCVFLSIGKRSRLRIGEKPCRVSEVRQNGPKLLFIIRVKRELKREMYVYYESIKREPKIRGIYECRCDERIQTKTKKFTCLPYTGLVLELEHLKIETRLISERFPNTMGECEN